MVNCSERSMMANGSKYVLGLSGAIIGGDLGVAGCDVSLSDG